MQMKRIEKKTWPKLFEEVKKGNKNFDLRLADFKCNKGDILVLREWDPKINKYTGRKLEKIITFITKTDNIEFWSKKDRKKYGFLVMSFK